MIDSYNEAMEHLKDKRYKANLALLEQLRGLIFAYPDMRFSQILGNFDFVKNDRDYEVNGESLSPPVWRDEYHLEPNVLLERVKAAISKVQST